jgi:hypothetical protein
MNDLEQELYETLAKEIAREMDEGIMSTMLVETGWTPVEFHFKDNYQAVDVQIWLQNTCKNGYRRLGSDYVFEDSKEAEWFILRWV